MTAIPIYSIPSYVGEVVSVLGFVRTIRSSSKKLSFLTLYYGPTEVQVVYETSKVTTPTIMSYIRVTGTVRQIPSDKYSFMSVEIVDASIQILSLADEKSQSVCPPEASQEVRLQKRHYYFRDPEFAKTLHLSDLLCQAIRMHFQTTHCREIIPPSFTGVECEGGATLFSVQHPGKSSAEPISAFLTQSSQFALEMTLPGTGDCFCIAPSFRAEHSHTRRHLTEFTHVESEWGGILTFEDHLDKLRGLLRGILRHFLDISEHELKKYGKYEKDRTLYTRVKTLYDMTADILVLDHKDAIKMCTQFGLEKEPGVPFSERDDIPEAQERQLIDKIGKIVFLVRFPKEFKSFYMALDPEDSSRVLGCDVEVPGVGEIIGSGVRESDYDRLYQRLIESGLKPDDYSEYLDLRKSGFAYTSGMGLGLGRMLTWILGVSSIREVVAFPRFPAYVRP